MSFPRQTDVYSRARTTLYWENLVLVVALVLVETFRFWDEYEYEYEIFSILSSARARTSVILAGKHDCRRHSTTSFRESDVV